MTKRQVDNSEGVRSSRNESGPEGEVGKAEPRPTVESGNAIGEPAHGTKRMAETGDGSRPKSNSESREEMPESR
jgi:hypothetical protein